MSATELQTDLAFHKILVATDFSPVSETAAAYAAGLARRFSSTLELTNAIDLAITASSLDALSAPALEALRRSARERLQQLADEMSGVTLTQTVIEGCQPSSVILDEAQQSNADLIVLGTSSKHGLKKVILGSTAEEIIRKARCPVLTIGPRVARPTIEPLRFKTIVYATDFSPQAARAARYAFLLSNDSEGFLYLCHVVPDTDTISDSHMEISTVDLLKELVPVGSHGRWASECVVTHGEASTAILKLAAQVYADLIIVGSREGSFWRTYVDTGVTPALLAEATCPVLTVS